MAQEHIVAVGLLTNRDLERLGSGFKRCFPVTDDSKFEDLLRAIDDADAALLHARCGSDAANKMPFAR
ncbi:hypothetical protein E5A73_06435 [Sphingomonas gei]|uniref:Uncharacterized protein n=1 Tax=Sphingomonas gei TaxID=1395960 RepID=A0A4S1XGJ4_9SPHN|nr:hypothetical protein [Sphingomonas gei]TGX55067.1 hypothetical protein E5A73_06435 [Sphingomonas gei]